MLSGIGRESRSSRSDLPPAPPTVARPHRVFVLNTSFQYPETTRPAGHSYAMSAAEKGTPRHAGRQCRHMMTCVVRGADACVVLRL